MKHLLKYYNELAITNHGRENFKIATGKHWTDEAILECIKESKLVKFKDVQLNGYSPNYVGRNRRGIKSWYAISNEFGWNSVFVISEGTDESHLILVTVLYKKLEIIRYLEERKLTKKSSLIQDSDSVENSTKKPVTTYLGTNW